MSRTPSSSDRGEPDPDPRVLLAADRTLLAWIRTALALIGFGFLLARLAMLGEGVPGTTLDPGTSRVVGSVMLVCGLVVNVASAVWYARFVRRYRRGEWIAAGHEWLPIVMAIGVTAMAGALIWLVA